MSTKINIDLNQLCKIASIVVGSRLDRVASLSGFRDRHPGEACTAYREDLLDSLEYKKRLECLNKLQEMWS